MSRYDWFRKRIAPIAFALAIVLMARQSCHATEHHRAKFVLDLAPTVHDVRADIYLHGERISEFHKTALDGMTIGHPSFDADLPDRDAELRIEVDGKPVVRHVVVDDNATITVPLVDVR